MKLSGTTPRPWVKLWKEETGAFAQLPFLTRAVASELLKFLDDDGRMYCGTKHPGDALAFVAGATRGDRRVMRTAIDQLIEVGHLRVRNGWLEAAKYGRWQYGREESEPVTEASLATPEPTSTGDEPATNGDERDTNGHEPATNGQRTVNEDRPKCAESRDRIPQEKRREEEEKRKSGEGAQARATPTPRVVDVPGIASIAEQVWAGRIAGRGGRHIGMAGDGKHFRAIAEAADATRGEEPLRSVLERLADEWLSTRKSTRLRVEWWAEWAVERAASGGVSPEERAASDYERQMTELEAAIAAAEREGDDGRVSRLHAEVVRIRDERAAALIGARAHAAAGGSGAGPAEPGQGGARSVSRLYRAIG